MINFKLTRNACGETSLKNQMKRVDFQYEKYRR